MFSNMRPIGSNALGGSRVDVDGAGVDPGDNQVVAQPNAEIIGANAADHGGACARPRGHDRLIAAFAAALEALSRSSHGLVRTWQGRGVDHDVEMKAATER
jgi:hypothetical protein